MTITENPTDTADVPVASKRFAVDYDFEVIDELPKRTSNSKGRPSVLEDQVRKVVENSSLHGKWVRIGKYLKPTAATAAKNVLQQRYGRTAEVWGHKFEMRRIPAGTPGTENYDENDRSAAGLFMRHDPTAIVEGALDKHLERERDRKAKLSAAKATQVLLVANAADAGPKGESVDPTKPTVAESPVAPAPTAKKGSTK